MGKYYRYEIILRVFIMINVSELNLKIQKMFFEKELDLNRNISTNSELRKKILKYKKCLIKFKKHAIKNNFLIAIKDGPVWTIAKKYLSYISRILK